MTSYATHFAPPQGPVPPAPSVRAVDPPEGLAFHDAMRVRAAATRAKAVYPGVLGEWLHDELVAVAEFGFRLDRGCRATRLVDHVMTAPIPDVP